MSRYINADTLIKAIPDTRVDMFENCRNCSTLLRDEVIEIIDAQPTTDMREVKHGHWIVTGRTNVYGGMEVTCSECGDTLMIQYLELEHFCRNCGADMRGEK